MKKNQIKSIMISAYTKSKVYDVTVTRINRKTGKEYHHSYSIGMRRWYLDNDLLYNPASYGIRPIVSLGVYPCILYIVKE